MVAPRVLPSLNGHREGRGPALLALPGLGSTWSEFDAVLPALTQRYDVLALDLPGQGRSPALPATRRPDIAALTDAVEQDLNRRGIGVPHVLGVSVGGRIGLELARRGRARSVVAIAPTGPATPPERGYQAALLALWRVTYAAATPLADDVVQSRLLRTLVLSPVRARGWKTSPEEAAAVIRAFGGAEDFWRLLRWSVLPEATVNYHTVRCPVVIAQGSHDVVSVGQALRLAALVPGAAFRWLAFAGHSSVADVPERVVALVDEVAASAARASVVPGASGAATGGRP